MVPRWLLLAAVGGDVRRGRALGPAGRSGQSLRDVRMASHRPLARSAVAVRPGPMARDRRRGAGRQRLDWRSHPRGMRDRGRQHVGGGAGWYALQRIPGFRLTLDRVQDALGLVVFAAMGSAVVSATIGVSGLYARGPG